MLYLLEMELLKSVRRRSNLSDALYIGFNLAFALAILLLTVAFSSPWVAYLVVLLSKWRVFAVRPRFWFANIQTNMVDVLVGLSVVTLIWQATGSLISQTILATLFAFWLLVLKPRSKRSAVVLQAGVAQFAAMVALFSQAYQMNAAVVVLVAWLVGYVVARHVLTHHEDKDTTLMSLAWGFIVAELSWLAYHSTVAYGIPGMLMIPQVALAVSLLGFAAYSLYLHHQNDDKQKPVRIAQRLWFVIGIMALLIGREVLVLI